MADIGEKVLLIAKLHTEWDRADAIMAEQVKGLLNAMLVLARQQLAEVTRRRDELSAIVESMNADTDPAVDALPAAGPPVTGGGEGL